MSEHAGEAPLVSICMPTFNRAEALREGLRDAQQQRYPRLEILISDNGSTDGTEAVCRAAAAADSRIRYVRQERNIGLYGNHNFLIEASRGAFIAYFHDHDEHDPAMVGRFVDFLQRHPKIGVVSADWDLIDTEGRGLGSREYPVQEVTRGLDYIEQTLRSGRSSVAIPGALIRREALGAIRFDEHGPIGFGDFVVWCEMAERWEIGHLRARLWRWRQDPKSQSARTVISLARDYDQACSQYCDAHLRRHPEHGELVARWRRQIRQFLFWALAYELGLHFRHGQGSAEAGTGGQTLFEILDYRLDDQSVQEVLRQLAKYRTGALQSASWLGIQTLIRLHATRLLAAATQYHGAFRTILGLK